MPVSESKSRVVAWSEVASAMFSSAMSCWISSCSCRLVRLLMAERESCSSAVVSGETPPSVVVVSVVVDTEGS